MTRSGILCGLVLLLLSFAHCSAPEKREPVTPVIVDDEPSARSYSIQRSDYEDVIKKGMAPVMQWYFVKPYYEGSTFVGFQIVEIFRETLKDGPLKVGDVLVSVNDMPIERPEHALAAWRKLWAKKKLKLIFYREGKKRVLEIPIVK